MRVSDMAGLVQNQFFVRSYLLFFCIRKRVKLEACTKENCNFYLLLLLLMSHNYN